MPRNNKNKVQAKRRRKIKNMKQRKNAGNNKNLDNIPFGIYYNYRNTDNESNLCMYRAVRDCCENNNINIGNSRNVMPEKWIKHMISRKNRRNDGEMGDTLDLYNFVERWQRKGNDVAIIVIDEEGNFKEGFVDDYYKFEPNDYHIFVIEWQDSHCSDLLHFESVDDIKLINKYKRKFLTEKNPFLTWID